jgi:hypothetical protein
MIASVFCRICSLQNVFSKLTGMFLEATEVSSLLLMLHQERES